jgi:hypothetical protein
VYVGRTKFLRVPFFWNPEKLVNPHICVLGTTGSGKSYFVKTFITRARLVGGSCAIILDWAGEYADWVKAAGGSVLAFGEAGINLLEPGESAPHARAKQVVSALEMLTDLSAFPAQKSLTLEAIEAAYLRRGYSLSPSAGREPQPHPRRKNAAQRRRAPPSLRDVHTLLLRQAKKSADARAAAGRLRDLLLSSGNSFTAPSLRFSSLFSGLVCVDLHSLPTESLRSLAGLAMLQLLKERMRQEGQAGAKKPRLFVVVDEAWKIASDERSDVISIVREGRKYGFALIVASQNPTDVHRSIFANSGTVVCFRITSGQERDYVRSSLAYSDFFERESHTLSVGQALVHLEFSTPVSCPKTFVLGRVDGEEPLTVYSLRGVGMELGFEKGELLRRLVSFGVSDREARAILSEFERKSYSLDAAQFVRLLERLGHSRASTISLLRQLGAGEREILSVISATSRAEGAGSAALIELSEERPPKTAAQAEGGAARRRGAGQSAQRRWQGGKRADRAPRASRKNRESRKVRRAPSPPPARRRTG